MHGEVVIAGYGVVTPYGSGKRALADAVFAGRSALRPVEETALRAQRSWVGWLGEPDDGGDVADPVRTAVDEALADLTGSVTGADRWAVVVPTCATAESMLPAPREWPPDPMPSVRDRVPARCQEYRVTAACSSTSVGVSLGRMLLLNDLADVVLVAGSLRLNPYDYSSLAATGTMAADPARPFDVDRSGMSLGEGAGAIVLVRAEDHARISHRRTPHARVLGASSLCRSRRPRTVDLEMDAATECMRRALPTGAGRPPVDLVYAHAVGTRQGDQVECAAIADVVGPDVAVSSHKGATGHLLHCSGFVAVALACQSLERQRVAPSVGTLALDGGLAVDHVPTETEERSINMILVNNFGFAGNYASLTLAAA